jgi:hypothetical protein
MFFILKHQLCTESAMPRMMQEIIHICWEKGVQNKRHQARMHTITFQLFPATAQLHNARDQFMCILRTRKLHDRHSGRLARIAFTTPKLQLSAPNVMTVPSQMPCTKGLTSRLERNVLSLLSEVVTESHHFRRWRPDRGKVLSQWKKLACWYTECNSCTFVYTLRQRP